MQIRALLFASVSWLQTKEIQDKEK